MAYDQLLKHRSSIPGASYAVTFCTTGRRQVLTNGLAERCADLLKQQHTRGLCSNHAWVVMPDHIHWQFTLTQGAVRLDQLVGRCKAAMSRAAAEILQSRDSALWQRGFHERRIRDQADLRVYARYLVANPLRAGLVTQLCAYPWWYAQWAPVPHGPAVGGLAERLLD